MTQFKTQLRFNWENFLTNFHEDWTKNVYLDILKIVPEPTMTNQAPLSLMNRLKKPNGRTDRQTDGRTDAGYTIIRPVIDGLELSVSQPVSVSVCPSIRKL
ncbi:hypothetical protein DPMN_126266 [Dreissena polymorpha]|uniref:Uncharacterized protein n=1 Tax=Dreissena polymorpha TaxID=45954 RepID=A0A9D4GZ74_DREPO|nr:hypothetical protein DPMN_126266 [Dreissena polymorpha]